MVWAYDLINEPSNTGTNIYNLQSQYELVKIVREIDPYTPIIIEFYPWANFGIDYMNRALPFKDIIYSVHVYSPSEYTHQGVLSRKNNSGSYPGLINDVYYNKTVVEKYYKDIIDFQNEHNAKIYMGEFSAILWAEGAEKYIEDVIQIAEDHEWDWTYHAFREWNGWSVEHEWLTGPRVETTARKEVLLKYYKLNENATFP